MENPIKMDDLGVPLFLETPIWYCIYSQREGEVGEILATPKWSEEMIASIQNFENKAQEISTKDT